MSTNFASQPADTILINKVVNGNLEAFNQLVLTYQNMAYNHAYAMLGDPALAEDATQDSFIKAFQGIQSFRGGSFRGWLLKIVTNSAYDILRRAQRHPTQALFLEDENGEELESAKWLADPNISVQSTVEQSELSKDIYKAIDDLPDVYRSALTLIDLHELDYAEAAQALEIPIGTLKSRLARARLKLKEKLKSRAEFEKNIVDANLCLAV
jgi:RNA polymerase sigma-70 factor (ECF subfamily)